MNQKAIVSFALASCAAVAHGAGFGLYEMSARGNAMGGALVGKAVDASANYYNPATLTSLTGTWFTVSASLMNPRCDTKVDGRHGQKMNAGWFIIPGVYASQELGRGFFLGVGAYADFGLGTKYKRDWPLNFDTTETTIEAYTVNPNIAYKATDRLSVAAGLRSTAITFDQRKTISAGNADMPQLGKLGTVNAHIRGEDYCSIGYNFGVKYDIMTNLSVGVTYRSRIKTNIKGRTRTSYSVADSVYGRMAAATIRQTARASEGTTSAKLHLPQSITFGANWDPWETFHVGADLTWTEWSSVPVAYFNTPRGPNPVWLKWHDTLRIGVGFCYDVTDSLSAMLGYAYDFDPSHDNLGSTMLPPGDRHIFSTGLGYRIGSWDFAVNYSVIYQVSDARDINSGARSYPYGRTYHFDTAKSFAHCIGLGATYHF